MADPDGMDRVDVNMDALKSEIRRALINQKANACPIAMRMAWHSSGTYDKNTKSGGSNGGTMRWSPEKDDEANKGLSIIRDLLLPVKKNHPEISLADLWAVAGCCAIEFLGGPKIPFKFGRVDFSDVKKCPENGRLPDASQGADHLRQVFGRMGLSDQDIVALSGAHTLGRMHEVRSGYDLPWTHNPLNFDNAYFVHLIKEEWRPRKWHGKDMFESGDGKLGMLPTDMALITDAKFRKHVEAYAKDEKTFFNDFAMAYAKLLCLGCPPACDPFREEAPRNEKAVASGLFRDYAMHGSLVHTKQVADSGKADVHQVEATSGRTALHKAAFWGHKDLCVYLLRDCKINPNVQDIYGDTALHDAAKFGHLEVAKALVAGRTNTLLKNKAGLDTLEMAIEHSHAPVANVIRASRSKL
mmetsp:Transcript_45767/g.109145  ORF Transcript_45767/g.109145 Transcript_45767/m.109145 type:complete len:413 (+) Transcript_45767:53-1291(+)